MVAVALWVPAFATLRILVNRHVSDGSMSAASGAALLALGLGSVPWLLQLAGAFKPDPGFAAVMTVAVVVPAFYGFRSVLQRRGPD